MNFAKSGGKIKGEKKIKVRKREKNEGTTNFLCNRG